MSYDDKQLQTFKFLQRIADGKQVYARKRYNVYHDIYMAYGTLYATNGIVLIAVDYPEFEHISDNWFMKVSSFLDGRGFLLKEPELTEPDMKMRKRLFHDMLAIQHHYELVIQHHYENDFRIDPRVLMDGLHLFKLYRINPNIVMGEGKRMMLTGHNNDVSIVVLMVGVR